MLSNLNPSVTLPSLQPIRVATAAIVLALLMGIAAWVTPVNAADTSLDDDAGSRVCFGAGENNAALFKNENGGFDLYGINGDDEGVLLDSWTGEELAAQDEETLTETLVLHENADYGITMYKLASGEYQVNAGPDGYGKTYVCTFEGLAPTDTIDTVIDPYYVPATE